MRRAVVIVAVALLLAGCGIVRLDAPGQATQAPPAAERLRQREALLASDLAVHASLTAADLDGTGVDADLALALEGVAGDARAHLEALGGVWEPPTPARQARGPVEATGADRVLAHLREAAATSMADSLAADGTTATLLASVTIARTLRADTLAQVLEEPPGGVGAPTSPELPETLDPGTAAELCRSLDALGHAHEVLAARGDGDARADAAARARAWRSLAEDVAAAAGLAGTPDDPREVTYAVPDGPEAAIEAATATLLPGWLAQVPTTSSVDRERVLAWATASARDLPEQDRTAFPGLG